MTSSSDSKSQSRSRSRGRSSTRPGSPKRSRAHSFSPNESKESLSSYLMSFVISILMISMMCGLLMLFVNLLHCEKNANATNGAMNHGLVNSLRVNVHSLQTELQGYRSVYRDSIVESLGKELLNRGGSLEVCASEADKTTVSQDDTRKQLQIALTLVGELRDKFGKCYSRLEESTNKQANLVISKNGLETLLEQCTLDLAQSNKQLLKGFATAAAKAAPGSPATAKGLGPHSAFLSFKRAVQARWSGGAAGAHVDEN